MAKIDWDWAGEFFSAKEIAAAIQGKSVEDIGDTDLVLRRVSGAYEEAVWYHWSHFHSAMGLETADDITPTALQCAAMDTQSGLYRTWMNSGLFDCLDNQKFTRTEIARWVENLGLASNYNFDTTSNCPTKTGADGGRAKAQNSRIHELKSWAIDLSKTYPDNMAAAAIAKLIYPVRLPDELKTVDTKDFERIIAEAIRSDRKKRLGGSRCD